MKTLALVARVLLLASFATVAWIPVLGLLASGEPPASRLVVAGLAVVALARPAVALVVLAGLAPLGYVIGLLMGMGVDLTEPAILAFLAGWLSSETCRWTAPPTPATRQLVVPVVLLAMVVVASSVVGMAALQPFVAFPRQFVREVLVFLWSNYFPNRNQFQPLTAGMECLEGVGLFAAAAILTARNSGLAPALTRISLAAAAGVAMLSLNRLLEVVLRSGDVWSALGRHLPTIRISAAFPDLNAAGSYFAMNAIVAVALGLGAARLRWIWAVAVSLLVAALWLTGSRVALFAVPITLAALLFARLRFGEGRRHRRLVLVALVALGLVGLAAAIPFAVRDPVRLGVAQSLRDRADLARAAVSMTARDPLFGVGIGRFKEASGQYFTPGLRRLFPRENAHNNFLQVLAELGVVGFVPFLWILAGVNGQAWRAIARGAGNWPLVAAAGGLAAFLVTCMSGHPLLILQVSSAFWILLGACAGLVRPGILEPPPDVRHRRWSIYFATAMVLTLVATAPARARDAASRADLAEAAIGYSKWTQDEGGSRVRWIIAPEAQFFVTAAASGVRVPFRLVASERSSAAKILIYVDDHLVDRVHLPVGTLITVGVSFPAHASRAFHKVGVEIEAWREPAPVSEGGQGAVEGIQMGEPMLTWRPSRER